MKKMLICLFILMMFMGEVFGQKLKDCEIMRKAAERAVKDSNYNVAIINLLAARTCNVSGKDAIDKRILDVLDLINKQKNRALLAEKNARQEAFTANVNAGLVTLPVIRERDFNKAAYIADYLNRVQPGNRTRLALIDVLRDTTYIPYKNINGIVLYYNEFENEIGTVVKTGIRIVNLKNGKIKEWQFSALKIDSIRNITAFPDGSKIVIESGYRKITILDNKSMKDYTWHYSSLALSKLWLDSNAEMVFTVVPGYGIQAYNLDGKFVNEEKNSAVDSNTTIGFSPNSESFAYSSKGEVYFIDTSGTAKKFIIPGKKINNLCVSDIATFFYTDSARVFRWNIHQSEPQGFYYGYNIESFKRSTTGKYFLLSSNHLTFLMDNNGRLVRKRVAGFSNSYLFSFDDTHLFNVYKTFLFGTPASIDFLIKNEVRQYKCDDNLDDVPSEYRFTQDGSELIKITGSSEAYWYRTSVDPHGRTISHMNVPGMAHVQKRVNPRRFLMDDWKNVMLFDSAQKRTVWSHPFDGLDVYSLSPKLDRIIVLKKEAEKIFFADLKNKKQWSLNLRSKFEDVEFWDQETILATTLALDSVYLIDFKTGTIAGRKLTVTSAPDDRSAIIGNTEMGGIFTFLGKYLIVQSIKGQVYIYDRLFNLQMALAYPHRLVDAVIEGDGEYLKCIDMNGSKPYVVTKVALPVTLLNLHMDRPFVFQMLDYNLPGYFDHLIKKYRIKEYQEAIDYYIEHYPDDNRIEINKKLDRLIKNLSLACLRTSEYYPDVYFIRSSYESKKEIQQKLLIDKKVQNPLAHDYLRIYDRVLKQFEQAKLNFDLKLKKNKSASRKKGTL